jgi:hypothetical protein
MRKKRRSYQAKRSEITAGVEILDPYSLTMSPPWLIQEDFGARRQWLMPVLLATQEAEIRRIAVRSQAGQIVYETLTQKTLLQKIGLVEWLKMKTLSSSSSTEKKKKGFWGPQHSFCL